LLEMSFHTSVRLSSIHLGWPRHHLPTFHPPLKKTVRTDINIIPWRSPSTASPPSPPSPMLPKRGSVADKRMSLTEKMETSGYLMVKQTVPEDATSMISSIWNVPWPQPPTSIPDSYSTSLRLISRPSTAQTHSRRDSPVSLSSGDALGYPVLSSTAPQLAPFQAPTIEPVDDIPESLSSGLKPPLSQTRRPSLRSLKSWDSFGLHGGHGGAFTKDVIYMTVVKETV